MLDVAVRPVPLLDAPVDATGRADCTVTGCSPMLPSMRSSSTIASSIRRFPVPSRATLIAVTVLLLAGACGSDQQVVTGGSADDAAAGSDVPARPEGQRADLVVSVELDGSLRAPAQSFRNVPLAAVYENGTILAPGATVAIYPGPALPAVTEGHVENDVVNQLMAAAGEAGLLDDIDEDFGEPTITHAATTTITVVDDGEAHVTTVYALDSVGVGVAGLTPGQRQARDRVGDFVDLVSRTALDPAGEQYVAERYRLLPLVPDEEVDLAVEADTRDWPLPGVALQEGECTAVSGQQADELRGALGSATEITRWRTASSQVFVLSVRPVLPHEPGCPE